MNDEEVFTETERLLSRLSEVDTAKRELEADKDRLVKKITDEFAAKIDPLTAEHEALTTQLSELFIEHEALMTGSDSKTAVFRSGSLSSRTSTGSLVVEDEEAAIAGLRKMHKLRAYTRVKLSVDKAKLKKHPEVYAWLPGVYLDKAENLLIRLARTQIELKRDLHPFRKRLR
jgi:phage host-nuclease inhibitor protein Gam